jgi:hypothetical protein
MSANVYKRFSVSDTFIVPYTANKSWDIPSASFADHRIVVNLGVNYSGSIFDPNNEFMTNGQYDRLVYNSINMTYYPKFLPSASSLYLSERQNTIYNDGTLTTHSYTRGLVDLGNLRTTKFFPTGANASIYVLNVPRSLTSEKILPGTFEVFLNSASVDYKLYDDGNYNLFYSGSPIGSSIGTTLTAGSQVGNVFYEQNVAIITIIPNAMRATAWRGTNPFCIQASPSATPSVTPTVSITPTVTPSISITPTVTPSISITPTVTPSVTPSISITPSLTPTTTATPTPSVTTTPPSSLPATMNVEVSNMTNAYPADINQIIVGIDTETVVVSPSGMYGYLVPRQNGVQSISIAVVGANPAVAYGLSVLGNIAGGGTRSNFDQNSGATSFTITTSLDLTNITVLQISLEELL